VNEDTTNWFLKEFRGIFSEFSSFLHGKFELKTESKQFLKLNTKIFIKTNHFHLKFNHFHPVPFIHNQLSTTPNAFLKFKLISPQPAPLPLHHRTPLSKKFGKKCLKSSERKLQKSSSNHQLKIMQTPE
jgi:hypothetical protein